VNASSDSLANAHRIAIETEQIGTNVLSDLHSQRQQLENARDNVHYVLQMHY
jgi:vesicle transport through interaction with t-SNAREs protein 1